MPTYPKRENGRPQSPLHRQIKINRRRRNHHRRRLPSAAAGFENVGGNFPRRTNRSTTIWHTMYFGPILATWTIARKHFRNAVRPCATTLLCMKRPRVSNATNAARRLDSPVISSNTFYGTLTKNLSNVPFVLPPSDNAVPSTPT